MKRLLLLSGLLLVAASAGATTYELDPDHSSVEFKIRHLVGKVRGRFEKFSGTFDYDAKAPSAASASAAIDAASINTNVEARDKHLRSVDFFDVEKCPELSFKSTKAELSGGGKGKLSGDLTIHCVTKPVVLDIEVSSEGKDPWGNIRIAVTATAKLDRKDFGLTWNKALEVGSLLVGDDVEVTLELEGMQKNAEAPAKKAEAPAKKTEAPAKK